MRHHLFPFALLCFLQSIWWVGDNEVGFIAQLRNLFRAEVTVAVEIVPLHVVNVDTVVTVYVTVGNENAAVHRAGLQTMPQPLKKRIYRSS